MAAKAYSRYKLWAHYADVFNLLGGMPTNGDARIDADCAIALSFARNTIPDALLPETRLLLDDRFKGNHLAMIEHLCAQKFDAGAPNNAIGNIAEICLNKYHIPLIGQWEIPASICKRLGTRWLKEKLVRQRLFCLWPPNREWPRKLPSPHPPSTRHRTRCKSSRDRCPPLCPPEPSLAIAAAPSRAGRCSSERLAD